jgi:hypothetical protein
MPADTWAGVLEDLIFAAGSRGVPLAARLRDAGGSSELLRV